ncbi:MAG: hypothetical protein WD114_07110 [Phycisphaerales bacterium]
MIMNIAVVLLVLGIAYVWMVRGVFSSMLQMLCVLFAGAIALAFWEKLALMLVDASPQRGFLSFLESIAWGVALVIPFVIYVLLLRLLADKLIPGNITSAKAVNYAGGAVCGLVTGVIATGVLVLGVSNLRLPTTFLGYQPLWYSSDRAVGAGSLVRSDSLWIPVDQLVAGLYARMSSGTLSTEEPLAKWYPELELVGFASRVSPGEGAARNAVRPDDFQIKSVYTVGDSASATPVAELLKDGGETEQRYIDIGSEPVATGSLIGYVVEFEPGAKERGERGGGQLVVSNGQFRLLAQNDQGESRTIFPVATISESSEAGKFGRWRYDAPDVFITSTGGQSRVPMAFEFIVPQGYQPLALYVKNVRVPATSMPEPVEFATTAERDRRVRTGSILTGTDSRRELETAGVTVIDPGADREIVRDTTSIMDLVSTSAARRGLTLDDQNEIVDGEGNFDVKLEVGRSNAPVSRNLRVEDYAVGRGQSLIKINVGAESPIGFLSENAREAPLDAPLLLIDSNGNEYEAIGFEYKDREIMTLRYTRGSTLSGVQDTPSLSTTRDDQELNLLFIVTSGVEITHFAIGDVAIARFEPPID